MNLKDKTINNKPIAKVFKSFEEKEKLYGVYSVPLSELKLNPYNGRFRASSHDENNGDEGFTEAQKMQMIENQSITKFLELISSIKKDGQNEPLIVNHNGIVIDGNRRLSVLNKAKVPFAKVIFTIGEYSKRLEIEELETKIQFGNPDKETYSPLNREIKISNIYKNNLEIGGNKKNDIEYAARVMHVSKTNVEFAIFKEETINYVFEKIGRESKYKWFEGTTDQFKSLKTVISKTFDSKSTTNKDEWFYGDDANKEKFIIASVKLIMCKTKAVAGTRILFGSGKRKNIVSDKELFDEYIDFIETNIDWNKIDTSTTKKGKTAYSDIADQFVKKMIEKMSKFDAQSFKTSSPLKASVEMNRKVMEFSQKFAKAETDKAYYHLIKAKEAIINAQKYTITEKAKREAKLVLEEAEDMVNNIGK